MKRQIGAACIASLFVASLFVMAVNLMSDRASASTWNISVVDPAGIPGDYISMGLDGGDRPQIGYTDTVGAVYNLKYAKWDGVMWNLENVDTSGDVGAWVSIAVDGSGYPHMTYLDGTNGDLKYAKWTGIAWSIQIIDSVGDVGYSSSLVLDASGYPHVSYLDHGNMDLKYASWDGSVWNSEVVDSAGDVGWYTSLALDGGGNPHISYLDTTNVDLKYAEFDGVSWNIRTVDSAGEVGRWTSLKLDSGGNPHISYYDTTNGALKYARWDGSIWRIETVDSSGDVGRCTSLGLDMRDYAHISYLDFANLALKYAEWTGYGWSIETVDSGGSVGWFGSMVLDHVDRAHISYADWTNSALKYAMEGPNSPPDAPSSPSGPGICRVDVSCSYSTSAMDPNNDLVNYTFDWGDGNVSETGFNSSGFLASMSHVWTYIGVFQVKAMATDIDGATSAWSTQLTVTVARPPGAPTILSAVPSDKEVVLSWTAPSSDGGSPVTNYRIYRGTSPGTETFLTEVGNVVTYPDTGLVNGQIYYYNLTAKNAIGDGATSNEVNAIPLAVPGPPTGLVAAAGNGQVALSWQEPANDGGSPITNYTIWRGATSGGESSLVTINDTTSYLDTGLTNGQTYYYRVSANNSVGNGPNSTEVSATPITIPSAPLGLQALAGDAQVALTWSAPATDGGSPIIAYRIYRGTAPGTETLLAEIGNVLSYQDNGVTNGQTYYYTVKAVNAEGEGTASNEVTALPAAAASGEQKPIFEEIWFWAIVIIVIVIIAAVIFLAVKRRKNIDTQTQEQEDVVPREGDKKKG